MTTSLWGVAQDKTFAIVARPMRMGTGTIMMVPYENKMFISDINREVHNRTGLELDEIRRLFREGLMQVISNEAVNFRYNTIDILNSGMDGDLEDIERVHASVGYNYEKLPEPDKEDKKLVERMEKAFEQQAPDQSGRGVNVGEGEILTYYDGKERYMDAVVYNPQLFTDLNGHHTCDYVLIINELDIRVLRNHDAEMGQIWDRMVKVHYNWFDSEGNKLYGGAAYYEYAGDEKDIYTIIRKSFTPIAQQILVTLPVPQEEEAGTPNGFGGTPSKQEEPAKDSVRPENRKLFKGQSSREDDDEDF